MSKINIPKSATCACEKTCTCTDDAKEAKRQRKELEKKTKKQNDIDRAHQNHEKKKLQFEDAMNSIDDIKIIIRDPKKSINREAIIEKIEQVIKKIEEINRKYSSIIEQDYIISLQNSVHNLNLQYSKITYRNIYTIFDTIYDKLNTRLIWDYGWIYTTILDRNTQEAHTKRRLAYYTTEKNEYFKKKELQQQSGGGKKTRKVGMDPLKKLMALNPFVLQMMGKKVKSCTCKTGGKLKKSKKSKKRSKRTRRTRKK